MIKRIIRNNSFSLILMILISLIAQVLSIMKSSIVAGTFGLSVEMDAYNFANSFVSLLFGLIAGGIPTIVIPSYVKKEKRECIDSFLTITYSLLFIIIVLILLFRYQMIGIFTNRDEMFVNIACNVLIVLLLSQYVMSITDITVAYFQCNGNYNVPKIINLFSQLIVIILLILIKNFSIYGYAIIISLGVLFNFFIDIYFAAKSGWRYWPRFLIRNKEVKNLFKKFIPIVLSCSVYNISLFIDSTIASRFDVGKLSILSYSNQISSIINSVLIGNLLIYAYPKIISKIETDSSQSYFWDQVILFHAIVTCMIIGFIVIGYEGISFLFMHGKFDQYATRNVYIGTAIYMFGMQTNVIRDLIYRYFYAKGDTKTPANNSIFISITNIIISLMLVYFVGFYGVIIGTVIASFISLIMIFIKFKNKIGVHQNLKKIIINLMKNILVCCLTLIIVICIKREVIFNNDLINIIIYGIITLILFLIISYIFNRRIFKIFKKV